MKQARIGEVYHPVENTEYAYVVVRADREVDRVWCLILWSNVGLGSALAAGRLFDEPLSQFESELEGGVIKRFACRPKSVKVG